MTSCIPPPVATDASIRGWWWTSSLQSWRRTSIQTALAKWQVAARRAEVWRPSTDAKMRLHSSGGSVVREAGIAAETALWLKGRVQVRFLLWGREAGETCGVTIKSREQAPSGGGGVK